MGNFLGAQCKLDQCNLSRNAICESNYRKIGQFVVDCNRKQAFEGDIYFPDFASACWYSLYIPQIA